MKSKPNLEAFLSGGAVDKASRVEAPEKEAKEQKIFRLPVSLIEAVKAHSYTLSDKEKKRISETEVVERALKKYLNII
jgi:hypothetical protein